jgi:hypothetical protein
LLVLLIVSSKVTFTGIILLSNKMKIKINCITSILILLFFYSENLDAQNVKIPKGTPIMVDGKFSVDEWKDAAVLKFNDSLVFFFKQTKEFVYVGIQPLVKNHKGGWIDLYITDNKEIYNLHASRKLGERRLEGMEWSNWGKWWTNEGYWTANFGRPEDMILEGKPKVIQLNDDGWEFQIRKSKFIGKEWKLMIDVSIMLDGVTNFIYPSNSTNTQSNGWIILKI